MPAADDQPEQSRRGLRPRLRPEPVARARVDLRALELLRLWGYERQLALQALDRVTHNVLPIASGFPEAFSLFGISPRTTSLRRRGCRYDCAKFCAPPKATHQTLHMNQ